jgi:outer membrane lipoprotein-sorting protein
MFRNTTTRTFFALALLAVLTAGAALAQEAKTSEMTLDEVLAMNLEARGGADKLAEMKTARFTGKMTMGPMEAPFIMEWERPNKVRMDFTVQGQTGTQAFDGETAWMNMPFMGATAPEKMPEDQAKSLAENADAIEGPLVNWQDKGHQVEYLGIEEIDGTPAHKLHVTLKSGDEQTIYLDAEYGLQIKQLSKATFQGQQIEQETDIGDYKEVDGLMIPFSLESKVPGAPAGQSQMLTFEKVELNVEIPEDRFEFPAPAPKDADNDNG